MAKALNLVGGGQPHVAGAFTSWVSRVSILLGKQTVTDGLVSTTWTPYTFTGCVEPYVGEDMRFDMDGQRSWNSMQAFVTDDVVLMSIGDRVQWGGKLYKVRRSWDFHQNGYRRYLWDEVAENA